MTPFPKVILIVDDEPDIRDSLAMLLSFIGFSVATAANGCEALDYLRSHPPPRLIILDLRMPKMNGSQFREEQCKDPALARIPVIVCSAEFNTGGQEALGDVAAFCPKASDPLELISLVQRFCP